MLNESAVYETEIKKDFGFNRCQYIFVQNKTGINDSLDENEHQSIPQESSIPESISIN
jgi:hypothetical protein